MKKIILLVGLFVSISLAQNLTYEVVTVDSADSTITIDLGVDYNAVSADYAGGNEFRVIGLLFSGTWTNTSLTVKANIDGGATYYTVKDRDGTALTITMATNVWVYLKPTEFAGMRYIELSSTTPEGDTRTLYLIKRQY
ncbi:MAG: hypothetical protein IPJ03_15800 [Ignavibacteriales bacterium]|nr:hypothetical protein [Ignavibacteriales bacterium]